MASFNAAFHPPHLKILSDDQIHTIYRATLACLQRTGVEVHNEEAKNLLGDAGAEVNGNRVKIQPHIIEAALDTAPERITVYGQDPRYDMAVEPGQVRFGPGPTCTYFIDPRSGETRKTKTGDPATTARVCDALDNIDFIMSLGLIDDVTSSLASVYEFSEMIAHTCKPVLAWAFKKDHLKDIYQIALAAGGGEDAFRRRPIFGFFSTWQAPLIHTNEDLANCLWAIEKQIPLIYIGGGAAGLSGPVTGAGLLVSNLACMLSGLAIFQLKKAGTPVCLGAIPGSMDLRTARFAYGGPEMTLYSAAVSDIAHYLRIPFMGTAGATESKVVDPQAAIEGTLQIILSRLSGAHMVHDAGFLDCANIGSLEMLVMSDEIIALAKRIAKGIEVSEETLMLDLIDKIGPGGNFIATQETAMRCRDEILMPTLMDRDDWVTWQENGAETMQHRIRDKIRNILALPPSDHLSADAVKRISVILKNAELREGSGTN